MLYICGVGVSHFIRKYCQHYLLPLCLKRQGAERWRGKKWYWPLDTSLPSPLPSLCIPLLTHVCFNCSHICSFHPSSFPNIVDTFILSTLCSVQPTMVSLQNLNTLEFLFSPPFQTGSQLLWGAVSAKLMPKCWYQEQFSFWHRNWCF